jgi:hypothetical protein
MPAKCLMDYHNPPPKEAEEIPSRSYLGTRRLRSLCCSTMSHQQYLQFTRWGIVRDRRLRWGRWVPAFRFSPPTCVPLAADGYPAVYAPGLAPGQAVGGTGATEFPGGPPGLQSSAATPARSETASALLDSTSAGTSHAFASIVYPGHPRIGCPRKIVEDHMNFHMCTLQ